MGVKLLLKKIQSTCYVLLKHSNMEISNFLKRRDLLINRHIEMGALDTFIVNAKTFF